MFHAANGIVICQYHASKHICFFLSGCCCARLFVLLNLWYTHLHYVAIYAKRVEKRVHAFQKWPIHNKFLSRRPFRAIFSLTQEKNIFNSSNLPSYSPQKLLRCLSTLFGREDDLLRSAVLQYYVWVFYTIDTVRKNVICCVGLLRVFKSNKMTTYWVVVWYL